MSLLIASRTTQDVLTAHFTFNWDDTMVGKAGGAAVAFSTAASKVVVPIPLPPNSMVVGGDISFATVFATSTALNITVGDDTDDDRYLTVTDLIGGATTLLLVTGYINETGENIELIVEPTVGAATAGQATLRVEYIVMDRACEVQIA
jgi:hypothetical protein